MGGNERRSERDEDLTDDDAVLTTGAGTGAGYGMSSQVGGSADAEEAGRQAPPEQSGPPAPGQGLGHDDLALEQEGREAADEPTLTDAYSGEPAPTSYEEEVRREQEGGEEDRP